MKAWKVKVEIRPWPWPEGGYVAEVPSLQGCSVVASTIEEAIRDIYEVIEMSIASRLKHGELKRRLRRLGVVVDRQGARHELWLNPATQRRAAIPRHDQREVPAGMLHEVLQKLGIPREDLEHG